MPKWVYPLAFLFVLFLIYTDPTRAGDFATGFAEFLVNLLGRIGEFLTGLFEGASGADPSSPSGSSIGDSFTHTHDGTTHTHGG